MDVASEAKTRKFIVLVQRVENGTYTTSKTIPIYNDADQEILTDKIRAFLIGLDPTELIKPKEPTEAANNG